MNGTVSAGLSEATARAEGLRREYQNALVRSLPSVAVLRARLIDAEAVKLRVELDEYESRFDDEALLLG